MEQQKGFEYIAQWFSVIKILNLLQWVILHEVTIIMLEVKMAGRNESDFSL